MRTLDNCKSNFMRDNGGALFTELGSSVGSEVVCDYLFWADHSFVKI